MYAHTDTHRINIHRWSLGVSPQETKSIFYPVFLGHVSGLPDQVPLWLDFIVVMFKGFLIVTFVTGLFSGFCFTAEFTPDSYSVP